MRKAVLLRVIEQLPYDEIAERLGCTAGNARVRVCRGLDRLEAYLEAS
jgi:DNA-directed RNA polymerase specialized sigma24 family protein